MLTRISDTMPYASGVSVLGSVSSSPSTDSSNETGQADQVSISKEAKSLEKTYTDKKETLEERYATEADQLKRDFEQEKAQLQQEYEQKKQSLGISIVV